MSCRVIRVVAAAAAFIFANYSIAGTVKGREKAEEQTAQARLALLYSNATINQESDTSWSLTKSGSAGANNQVTYTVDAVQGAATPNILRADGFLLMSNFGNEPATIGNIVVNLQRKSGTKWSTVSSDIANVANGSGATTANVCSRASSEKSSSFSTNSASGLVNFTDAKKNTVFSLSPRQSVPAYSIMELLFQASYNNTVLAIPSGEKIRLEVIVSFGNAGPRSICGAACSNLDIDGDGTISADEKYVRSVPTLVSLTVPALQTHNASMTLTDDPSHLTESGTATVSQYQTDIGGGTGTEVLTASSTRTVSIQADPGSGSGSAVTNCANLDSSDLNVTLTGPMNPFTKKPFYSYNFIDLPGSHLQACATVNLNQALVYSFQQNDVVTLDEASWVSNPTGSKGPVFIEKKFPALFPSGLVIGSSSGFTATFDSVTAVQNFLPTSGAPGALTANVVDPLTTSAGDLAGQTIALQLNILTNDYSVMGSTLTRAFGDIVIVDTGNANFDGHSVRQILTLANQVLGGASTAVSFSDLESLLTNLNQAFLNGAPSAWATEHLNPTLPIP